MDSVVEQWNSYGGTVLVEQGWWNSETVIVNQCGGTLEQCGGTVLWNTGTVMVEQCWWNSVVEHWNSDSGTVWWNSVVEHWNSDGETVWWNTGTVMEVEQCGGTLEQ